MKFDPADWSDVSSDAIEFIKLMLTYDPRSLAKLGRWFWDSAQKAQKPGDWRCDLGLIEFLDAQIKSEGLPCINHFRLAEAASLPVAPDWKWIWK